MTTLAENMAPAATATRHAEFRKELRDFARSSCPVHIRSLVRRNAKLTRKEWSLWQRALYERGWGAPGWPTAYGGTGWDVHQRIIFEDVMAEEDCPVQYHHGLGHIGPVLMEFGTRAQKARFLPRILSGEEWWCQGYSEPGAGSDLASLKTAAVREGDCYRINGQKAWTSHAHEADWMYALVRTSVEARKQGGVSLLLVPLSSPGITVKPLRTIEGWHHLNEVFFDDVIVPVENLVGEEGKGWRCAKYLLDRERLPPAGVPRLTRLWQHVAALVERSIAQGGQRRELEQLRSRVLLAEAELKGARHILESAVEDLLGGRPLGARPSILKLLCSELGQRIMEIGFDVAGPAAMGNLAAMDEGADLASASDWVQSYLFFRSRTLAGGTSEVQRNVIARELFGS